MAIREVMMNNVQGMRPEHWKAMENAQPELVCVWGGCVANIGEDELTKWMYDDRRRLHVERFIYYPDRTKGGAFPRPLYFQGVREANVEFPACRLIGLPAIATIAWWRQDDRILCPADWGWVAPALQHIIVYTCAADDKELPFDLAAFREKVRLRHPGVTKVQLVHASRAVPWPQEQTVAQELE